MAQAKLFSSPFSAKNSPRGRRHEDSPSRQLQVDLDAALANIHLHEIESSKLHAFQRRQQQEELDAKEAAQARVHHFELNAAFAQHDGVLKQAEAVLQAELRHQQEEKERREREEQRRLEEQNARIKAEQEARQREQERKAQEEKERRDREEKARQEADRLAKQRAQAEAEEKERKEKEAAEHRERERVAKAEHEANLKKQEEARQAAAARAVPPPQPKPSSPNHAANPEVEKRHNEYLALHKKLKTFRKDFFAAAKKDAALKPHVGDMRRAMKASIGQLTDDKSGNRKAQERVKANLMRALKELPSPPVPVSNFLPAHLDIGDNGTTMVPSLVIYLLSMFSKSLIEAFVGECAVNPKAAEPIGTLAAQVFSMPELQLDRSTSNTTAATGLPSTQSLIPILMCKFHAAAPILFGISGSESTSAGRLRLGWRRDRIDDTDESKKAFVTQNKHYDRLTGLGVGYASIALRNFSKARYVNPWPPVHFWSSLAHIVNTAPQEVQTSHMIILKNMLENNATERFILFFGAAGIAALRQAVVEFPKSLPEDIREKQVTKSIQLMVEGWKKENHFSLT